ncbi:hypothetical protein V6N11_059799 [Hibiscus sabdariffa]|uniref:Single-stranded DNA-binding protein n=1 Tax=Hibiscus sabdariffa TaxID=183260 RepID=A0ABR2NY51_9ROSI
MSALMVYVERGLLGRINSAQLLGLVENRFSLVLEACLKYLDAVLNNNIFRESKRIRIIERFPFRTLKCSADYRDQSYNLQVPYPKPSEIPWSKDLCNTVHLIGNVGAPVEIKHLISGKVLAWTRLAVRKSPTDTTWINLTFWDELANTAHQHVEKGQQLYVCGRLVSDTVESDDGKQQTYYKIVVQQMNFIERNYGK